MPTYPDPKTMAKALRQSLAGRHIELSHSDCLELVARQFGLANWNMLAARIEASLPDLRLPEGWFVSHPSPAHYRIGIDPDQPGVVLIAAVPGEDIPDGQTGVLMQSITASGYSGRKVRLTAELRAEDAGAGAIWLRVDPEEGRYLRFDNMLHRVEGGALRGTHDWVERVVILDVPKDAASIHFGMLLIGSGKLWARRFKIEGIDEQVAVTARPRFLPEPTNLGFERLRSA